MPLGQIFGGSDGDQDPWPHGLAETLFHVCSQGSGGAAGEVPQQLPTAPEERTQEARDGHDDVAMGDGLEDLLMELGPQKRAFLLAGRAERPPPTRIGDELLTMRTWPAAAVKSRTMPPMTPER
jgi:hypothetical protein